MPKIKLQSSDDEVIEVDIQIAKCCAKIKTILKDMNLVEDEVIPLPFVNSAILRKVITWLTYHKDDLIALQRDDEDDEEEEEEDDDYFYLSDWDFDFLNDDWDFIFELMSAAFNLHIKTLTSLTCKYVAFKMEEIDWSSL